MLAAIVQTAREYPKRIILEDATGQMLTYRQLMTGTRLLAHEWQTILPSGNAPIGVLLPNVNAAAVIFLSLWSAGKIPASLNYSSVMAMLVGIQLAGIRQIITSRKDFLERAHIETKPLIDAGVTLLYIEEIRAKIARWRELTMFATTCLCPGLTLGVMQAPTETAMILFTSGSEGMPKGVALTHANLMSNIHQMLVVNDFQDTDRLFNCLPLFHSFSLTVGTLLPLVRGIFLFLYPSPVHYRVVPALFYDKNCTILLGTNTFLNGYARRAHPYDFRSLRYLFAGAEKVQDAGGPLGLEWLACGSCGFMALMGTPNAVSRLWSIIRSRPNTTPSDVFCLPDIRVSLRARGRHS